MKPVSEHEDIVKQYTKRILFRVQQDMQQEASSFAELAITQLNAKLLQDCYNYAALLIGEVINAKL